MIIFLYGPDTYRSRKKLSALKQKFISSKDKKGISVAELNAREINVDLLRKAILSSGLFSEKRLIIIKGILQSVVSPKEKELLNTLAQEAHEILKNTGGNILIFFDKEFKQNNLTPWQKKIYTALKKTKYAQEFKHLKRSQLMAWIKKYVTKHDLNIEPSAIKLLVDICGNNLWNLQNELDKLIAYSKSLIQKKDVHELIISKTEQNIWNLIDAIGQKNKSYAIHLLSDQINNGTSIDYIIAMLAHQYRIIIRIKSYLEKNNSANSYKMSSELSLHPFVCKKGLMQEKNYALKELKKIYHQLLKIDFLRKTKRINSEALLDLLIAGS